MSEKKSLKYFMRQEALEEKIVKAPGPDTIKDESGNPIMLEIKVLSSKHISEITEKYHTKTIATDKRGNPLISNGNVVFRDERDNTKATAHILVEALVYPDLKDPDLMKFFNAVDVTEMPRLVFHTADEYAHVTKVVLAALGLGGDISDEELRDANDAEVNEVKN